MAKDEAVKKKRTPKDADKRVSGAVFFVRFTPAIEALVRSEADRHELTVASYLRLVVVKFLKEQSPAEAGHAIAINRPAPGVMDILS